MGLDMYLHAKKYVEKVNWQALHDNDELSMDSPEVVNPLWKELVSIAQMLDVATDIYGAEVSVTCAYWRKSNQIHKWFVDNVQGGEDDCGDYYVSHEKLKELRETCRQALLLKTLVCYRHKMVSSSVIPISMNGIGKISSVLSRN